MKHLVILILDLNPLGEILWKTPYPYSYRVPLSVQAESKGPQKKHHNGKQATKININKLFSIINWWPSSIAKKYLGRSWGGGEHEYIYIYIYIYLIYNFLGGDISLYGYISWSYIGGNISCLVQHHPVDGWHPSRKSVAVGRVSLVCYTGFWGTSQV